MNEYLAHMDLPSSGSEDEEYERSARADQDGRVQLVAVRGGARGGTADMAGFCMGCVQ